MDVARSVSLWFYADDKQSRIRIDLSHVLPTRIEIVSEDERRALSVRFPRSPGNLLVVVRQEQPDLDLVRERSVRLDNADSVLCSLSSLVSFRG